MVAKSHSFIIYKIGLSSGIKKEENAIPIQDCIAINISSNSLKLVAYCNWNITCIESRDEHDLIHKTILCKVALEREHFLKAGISKKSMKSKQRMLHILRMQIFTFRVLLELTPIRFQKRKFGIIDRSMSFILRTKVNRSLCIVLTKKKHLHISIKTSILVTMHLQSMKIKYF